MALVEVRYKGLSDVRIISKKDWEKEGVAVSGDTIWQPSNRWTQNIDANERMLEVLRAEAHFSVRAVNDDNSLGDEVVVASDPEREPDVVVDGNTGQREENKRKAEREAALAAKAKQDKASKAAGQTGSTDTPAASGAGTSGSTGRGSSTSGDSA